MYTRRRKPSLPGPDDILRQTLPNGITILARENFNSPAVVIDAYIEVGSEDELGLGSVQQAQYAGLADLSSDVLERGTQRRTFNQLYEEVESIGANFGLSTGVHITSFGAKGLAEDLPLLLDILSDVLRNPAFRPEQVEKARHDILTELEERRYDIRRMAALTFKTLTYPPEHPYHYSVTGYTETVSALSREDLLNFHQRYYAPQGMVIVIVGAIKNSDVYKAVTQVFEDWSTSRPEREPLPPVPALTKRREKRVRIPDRKQSKLILGWPGPHREDPDFLKCYLCNTVLGVFGMMGRLGKVVRDQNGLAYYTYSQIDGGKGPGAWRISAGVNPANVDQSVDLILQEVQRLQEQPVPEEELNDSKSYLTGSLPIHLETNEGVAQMVLNMERYNLGLDYIQRYRDLIAEITPSDIQAMAQHWLDPEHFALAIAEPAS